MPEQWEVNVVPCGVEDFTDTRVSQALADGWEPFSVTTTPSGIKLFLRRIKTEDQIDPDINAMELVDLFSAKRRAWDTHVRAGVAAAETEHDVQGWECLTIGCKVLIEFAIVAALHSAGIE